MNDSLTAEIRAWLRAGAEVTAGLLLFSQFSNNTRFASLVKIKPAKYRPLLIEKLCTLAGITPPSEEARPARRRFRDDFPFLRAPDCPPELKILAADKITAHERYIQAHERLFDCTTLNECYTTAREAIDRTEDYFRALGMPTCFTELGCGVLTQAELEELARRCTFHGQRPIGAFRVLGYEDILAIYQLANR